MMSHSPSYSSKGFTLIELLVVIAIIGTISSVVMVSLNSARNKARDAQVRSQVRQIINALNIARLSDPNGLFPTGSSGSVWYCLRSTAGSCPSWSGGVSWDPLIITTLNPYISSIPLPPNPPYKPSAAAPAGGTAYFGGGYPYYPNGGPGVCFGPGPTYTADQCNGTFLVWAQTKPYTDCQGYYAGDLGDGFYYCYQKVDP